MHISFIFSRSDSPKSRKSHIVSVSVTTLLVVLIWPPMLKNALKEINRINKNREKHYHYYTHESWRNINNYDLSINVDKMGVEKTAELIESFVTNEKVELAHN